MGRGLFISLEGGEGSGKSTQAKRLAEWLEGKGHKAILTREPGGTPLAEQIRGVIFEPASALDAATESLLFQAARTHHTLHKILPALESGVSVITDRYLDSTRVYQGILGEKTVEWVDVLHAHTVGNIWPDVTLLLDIPAEIGLPRAKSRGDATRFEDMEISAHEKIRQGFLQLAKAEPKRFRVIDATKSLDEVTAQIQTAITPFFTEAA